MSVRGLVSSRLDISIGAPFKPVASPAAHSLITSNPPKTQHMYQPDSYNSPMVSYRINKKKIFKHFEVRETYYR